MSVLGLIPARGGSKGLPGKNLALLAGLPLVAHAIRLAQAAQLDELVVSTDSEDVREAARRFGADAPFLRPPELAADTTPMWPVVRHAVDWCDARGRAHEYVVLVPPTSPFRLPEDVASMVSALRDAPDADGIVAVARPRRHPLWVTVVERDGWMEYAWPVAAAHGRRQDLPEVFEITGGLYAWRTSFVSSHEGNWPEGRHLLHVTAPESSLDIDASEDLALAEAMVQAGQVDLPWLR